MARKNNPKQEPEAIVHTRALFIKQSDELAKLIDIEVSNVERANAALANAQMALNVVHVALEKLTKGVPGEAAEHPSLVESKPSGANNVNYVTKDKALLHNIICILLKKGGKWRPTTLREKASEIWKEKLKFSSDPPTNINYDHVQQILTNLVKRGLVARPGRGQYMWGTSSKDLESTPERKKKKSKRSSPLAKWKRAKLSKWVQQRMENGKEHSPYELHAEMRKSSMGRDVAYRQLWGIIHGLVRRKKVVKVSAGKYKWVAPSKKPTTKKKTTKKKVAKKKPLTNSRRKPWMDAVNKCLALYDSVTVKQLWDMLADGEHKPNKQDALRSYLRRQVEKGNLKQPKRGHYAQNET